MLFIPEEWDRIKLKADNLLTVGKLVESRFLADVELGMCSKEDKYSLVSEGQSDEEIRRTTVSEYENKMHWSGKFVQSKLPEFIVETGKGYSYRLCFEDRENRHSIVWLQFVEDMIKESDSIYYQIKQAVIENGGNPDEIITTLTDYGKFKAVQHERYGWTAWCGDWVYFPAMYDGDYWVASAPRNPCDIETGPVGGG